MDKKCLFALKITYLPHKTAVERCLCNSKVVHHIKGIYVLQSGENYFPILFYFV